MNKLFLIVACLIITGCSTALTEGSLQITEYKNVEQMNRHAQCTAMGDVLTHYSILKVSPLDRASTTSLKLKDAALKTGANAIIVTSTFYGNNMDKAQGEAYQCFLRRDWYDWELRLLNDELKTKIEK
jgi:hypothetical protein